MIPIYLHSILSLISCIAFGILFNVKKTDLFLCAVSGSIAWTLVIILNQTETSYIFVHLFAAFVVGFCAEFFAVIKKTPATAFIVIGVIPLVPGFRVYKSMLFFISGKINPGMSEGISASFIAVAIAVGIILSTSLFRLLRKGIRHYTQQSHRKRH